MAFGEYYRKHRLPHVLVSAGTTISKIEEVENEDFLYDIEEENYQVKQENLKNVVAKENEVVEVVKVDTKVDNDILNKLKSYRKNVFAAQQSNKSKLPPSSFNSKTTKTSKKDESQLSSLRSKKRDMDDDEMENPVEADAIKKIISFLKYLSMRKGYWKLNNFLKMCTDFVDTKFASKITNSNCEHIFDDNPNIKLRLRLSGETWPPYVIYKFLIPTETGVTLPLIKSHTNADTDSKNKFNQSRMNTSLNLLNKTQIIKPIMLEAQIREFNLSYDHKKLGAKEDYYRMFNSKNNYYRYIFTNELYVPYKGNQIKRSEKMNNKKTDKMLSTLPFERINKPAEPILAEFQPYKTKLVKNNVMNELYIDLKPKEMVEYGYPKINNNVNKSLLKTNDDIFFYNNKYNKFRKRTQMYSYKWDGGTKGLDELESNKNNNSFSGFNRQESNNSYDRTRSRDSPHADKYRNRKDTAVSNHGQDKLDYALEKGDGTNNNNRFDKTELKEDEDNRYEEQGQINYNKFLKNKFMKNYKSFWKTLSTPRVYKPNKYVESKLYAEYFKDI